MHTSTADHLVLLCLVLAVDAFFCAAVAAATLLLARSSGVSLTAAILRGGVAFAGTATLSLAFLTFLQSNI
jgi:hypothetical protein